MFKEVKYNGYSSTPSDYQSPDGDLSVTLNAIPEDGAIKRLEKPKVVLTLPSGKKVVYIHSVSVFENYIIYDETNQKLLWLPSDNLDTPAKDILSLADKELYQVTAMGNTLILLTSTDIIYTLYKSDSYQILGSQPEFPSISFRLKCIMQDSALLKASFEAFNPSVSIGGGIMISQKAQESVKNTVLAYFNPLAADIKSAGRFQYPFMIRYAYRMYDDTLSYISQPVKLCPSIDTPLAVRHAGSEIRNGQITAFNLQVSTVMSELYYEITNLDAVKQSFQDWSELVKSIDFFITSPMTIINDAGIAYNDPAWGSISNINFRLNFHGCFNNETVDDKLIYRTHDRYSIGITDDQPFFLAPTKDLVKNDDPMEFRLVSSIKIKDLTAGEQKIKIEKDTLSSLENRELLKGDSDIKDKLTAKYAYPYNGRLNLTGVTVIPHAYPLESYFAYCNGNWDSDAKKAVEETYTYRAYILIEAEKRYVRVDTQTNIPLNITSDNCFFFFPNVNAKELIIERTDAQGAKTYSKTKFKKHLGLNGARAYVNYDFNDKVDMNVIHHTDIGIPYPNKIYTSEANDPFTFPATLVNAVGSGEIIGISSAAKALSEGQFGQFPLYAFTTEGVWALEVADTGGYYARQPVTRDVCISPESITQIDTSVLFASDRGIMMLSGSTSTCISEVIDHNEPLSLLAFPKGKELLKLSELQMNDISILPFRDFLRQSRMLYDYTHQHVIVYNAQQSYAYVFSLNSQQWGMTESNIAYAVNSYPESLAMDSAGNLINYSQEGEQSITSFLLTRPIKLDDPDLFKTINAIIQRGYFTEGSIKQVLYGSNDYRHWFPIKSSTNQYMRGFSGTPFKAFRLAIIANLNKYDTLHSCTVSYTPRMTNRLR